MVIPSERAFAITEVLGDAPGDHPRKLRLAAAEQTVGRSAQCQLSILIPTVSRRHAVLWVENGLPYIRDLDSGHGTFVNSNRIGAEPTLLRQGDLIALGREAVFLVSAEESLEIEALEKAAMAKGFGEESGLLELALSQSPRSTRARNYLEFLAALAQASQHAAKEERFFSKTVKALSKILDADRAVVFLGGEVHALRIGARRMRNAEDTDQWQPPSKGILRRALHSSNAVITFDAQTDGRFNKRTSIAISNIRSAICVRVGLAAETIGVLYADNQVAAGQFSIEDGRFLEVVSQMVALTVSGLRSKTKNAEVCDHLQAQLESSQNAVAGLADQISAHVETLGELASQSETAADRGQLLTALRDAASELKKQADPFVGWARQETTRSGVDASSPVVSSTSRQDQDLEDLELLYDQEDGTLDREIGQDIPTIESRTSDFFGGHTPAPVVPHMAVTEPPFKGDWSDANELDTLPPPLDSDDEKK